MPSDPLAWLESQAAQTDVIEGLRPLASDWPTLWASCPRGDWLLGIAMRLGVDDRSLVRAAALSARTALDYAEGEAPARVLDAALGWCDGTASEADVASATQQLEVEAARASSPAAEAAARAALAVGLGVTDREVLTAAPAAAAEATIVATIDCGLELAMGWAHRACADAVRRAVPWERARDQLARLGLSG
jgi:hypothetical protein